MDTNRVRQYGEIMNLHFQGRNAMRSASHATSQCLFFDPDRRDKYLI
jgi:hypothetical protein